MILSWPGWGGGGGGWGERNKKTLTWLVFGSANYIFVLTDSSVDICLMYLFKYLTAMDIIWFLPRFPKVLHYLQSIRFFKCLCDEIIFLFFSNCKCLPTHTCKECIELLIGCTHDFCNWGNFLSTDWFIFKFHSNFIWKIMWNIRPSDLYILKFHSNFILIIMWNIRSSDFVLVV